MRLRESLALGVLLLTLTASPASAQWFITPYAGASFGGDVGTEEKKFMVGAGVGFLGGGIFGVEADVNYTPDFFASDANLATVMANLILTARPSVGFRPYGTVGAGWIRSNILKFGDVVTSSNDDFGINVGGGFMAQFNDHTGLRGDIRFVRALVDNEEDNEFDVALGDFDFWRAGLGITFTF